MVYIDDSYKCHLSNPNGMYTLVETDFFNGKCQAYIEGYRFVPDGETWIRADGVMFQGEMITPWKDWRELDDAQRDYEREQLATIKEENATLQEENATLLTDMAQMVEEVYQTDIEILGI